MNDQLTTRRTFIVATAALPLVAHAAPAKIKIGQIGTGHPHASGKMKAIRKYPDIFEVVGIAEPDAARRKAAEKHSAYKGLTWMREGDLLSTPGLQAIAVETAVRDLVPTAQRCIHAGKHIHLDKPAGESMKACRQLHADAVERGLTIQMGYMFRYNPGFEFLFEVLKDGWLGEVREVTGMIGKKMGDGGRKDLATFPGGGMFELACHLIDAVVTVLGEPTSVTPFNHQTQPEKDGFLDNQMAVLNYPKAIATVRCNHVDPLGTQRRQFSVTGTEGTLNIQPLEAAQRVRSTFNHWKRRRSGSVSIGRVASSSAASRRWRCRDHRGAMTRSSLTWRRSSVARRHSPGTPSTTSLCTKPCSRLPAWNWTVRP
jgi:predicted dehydrogenase